MAQEHFFVLFTKDGAIINGQAHESEMCRWADVEIKSKNILKNLFAKKQTELKQNIWPGVVDKVPPEFHHFIFGEPIQSIGTTFCIWRKYSDDKWSTGDIVYPNDEYKDGSAHLLFILDNIPETYHKWAIDYFEDEFESDPNKLNLDLVKHIYGNKTLTTEIVLEINPNLSDFEKLKSDLSAIGYPNEL